MAKWIGKYEILRTLGQGAMGEVYLAHHPAIGREVAIKTILPSAARGAEAEGRFRREAEAAGHLNHPNLVTIFDFDKDQDVLFLVMEYVRGEDLEDLIRQKALPPAQFLEVLAQVCDGLSHAHRNGIIHRDIKPSNVRVIRDGANLLAKVMDFGVARIEDSNMTATGIVMGTVNYMAPEYIRDGRASAQSDLFAVGVMLYESLTGRKPFAGDTTTTVLFKIISEAPAPVDLEAIHGISPSIRTVLDRALAKDPAARYQTADDLGRALRACKDPTWSGSAETATTRLDRALLAPEGTRSLAAAPATPERSAGSAPTLGAPSGTSAARTRVAWYLAGAAAVALAAGGTYLAVRPRHRPVAPVSAAPPDQAAAPAPANAAPPPAVPDPAPVRTPPAPVPIAPAVPARTQAKPVPRTAPPAVAAVAPSAPEPVKPVAAPVEDPLKNIGSLIAADPGQAAAQLRPLVQAQPTRVDLQGNYLAALYRSRNAAAFAAALARATASGVTVRGMLAVPAFRSAMADESRLQKTKPPSGVLPLEVMAKVVEGL